MNCTVIVEGNDMTNLIVSGITTLGIVAEIAGLALYMLKRVIKKMEDANSNHIPSSILTV